jgi:hypothetical protein
MTAASIVKKSEPASWRARAARQLALVIAVVAAGVTGGVIYTLAWPRTVDNARKRPAQDGRRATPARDPLAHTILVRLAAEAQRTPSSSKVWSNGSIQVLNHVIDGDTWRFVNANRAGRTCWLLLVPQVGTQGSCGPSREVERRPLVINSGARPDNREPSGWNGYVVYGRVSPAVRSLRLALTDCTALDVRLATRPAFWAFVPEEKLRRHALPNGFILNLSGHRVRGKLLALRNAAGDCTSP